MSLENIEHVVVLMLENRSFDSMLGWLYEHDTPALNIPAAKPGDEYRGLQSVDLDSGQLRSTYQETPGGPWSPWSGVWNGSSPSNVISIAAAQQNDATVRIWVLDADGTLYSTAQVGPGEGWTDWLPAPLR